MSQSAMDGGSGGWNNFLGGVVQLAGNEIANKLTGGSSTSGTAETTADYNQPAPQTGEPTPQERSGVMSQLQNGKVLMIAGGLLLATVAMVAMRK